MPNKSYDKVQIEGIYNRLRRSLMRYASRYYRKPQDIEDVVQEAFIRVIEAQNTRNLQVSDYYLYRTVRNLAFKSLDKMENRLTDTTGDMLSSPVLLESASLHEQFEASERFGLFCRAVRKLPVKCQRVFILRRVYGFSHKEIAERMDISVKTVEIHLTKAIIRCTAYMDSEESSVVSEQPLHGKTAQGKR